MTDGRVNAEVVMKNRHNARVISYRQEVWPPIGNYSSESDLMRLPLIHPQCLQRLLLLQIASRRLPQAIPVEITVLMTPKQLSDFFFIESGKLTVL